MTAALQLRGPRFGSLHAGLELMQAELQSSQLEVVLVPCRHVVNEGGCVRVAVSRNCDWYRRFCASHASSRVRRNSAFDTRIKRRDTLRLLDRLLSGYASRSKYASELVRIAQRLSGSASALGGRAS